MDERRICLRLHRRPCRPRRHRFVAVAAVAVAAATAVLGAVTTQTVAAAETSSGSSGCPFARLVAFSEQVKTPAGRRALMAAASNDKDGINGVSDNPYHPSQLFASFAHDAAVSFAASRPSVPNPIKQAADAVSHAVRDHSHGLTDEFVDAYVSAALSAHGIDFLDLAAEDPVMSKRPSVQRALSLQRAKGKGGDDAGQDKEVAAALADPETHERANEMFKKAHRRALSGFLLPTTPPFSNYSASLGNSSTGVTAPKWSPILNVTSEGTISTAQALKWPGPANATRFESNWLSEIRTRGQNIRDSLALEDHIMRTAELVFRSLSTPINNGLLCRLAFHEAGTFDPNGPPGRKGGCNGSIRYELDWASNGGLQRFAYPFMWTGVQIMNNLFGNGTISYADGAAIIGAAGVANGGGPWRAPGYGRPDVTQADIKTGVSANTEVEKDFELPALLAEWQKFGFDAQALCILSGAHSFGLSGTSSPQGLLSTPVFSNKYYKAIEAGVGFFTSDKTLGTGETLECVQKCAVSQDYFFSEFSKYYFEMTTWGVDKSVLKGLTKNG